MPVKLTCCDCGKVCVGQTFTKRYEERFLCIRKKIYYENHTTPIEHGHSFNTMESIMQILRFNKKGAHLDTTEKMCIYKAMMKNCPLNGIFTI